ncbi:MAG TPA: hypothetical protein ENK36_05050 [Desulfobacterales bacterium]|nr:hypothetical protein [Desulfobacterales bacterium]
MFWDSVIDSLKVFTYWETYVAGLEYLAICFIPMAIVGMIMEKSEGGGAIVGCFSIIIFTVLKVAAMAVFVLTLAPIIFGFAEDAAWSFPWQILTTATGAFFKLVGVLIVVSIILTFIPVFGRSSSLQTLVLGGIALVLDLLILDSVSPGIVRGRVDFVPGFWFLVGFLAIGGVMSWVGMMAVAFIATTLKIDEKSIGQLFIFPIGAVFGFIPVFMYGAWLGAQMRGGF